MTYRLAMYDPEIESRIRAGGWLTTCGILLAVVAFFGTCVAAASNAGKPDQTQRSFETGQSPWLLLSLGGAIALITIGQVKKSNAKRDGEVRFREQHFMKTEKVVDTEVPGGPFRGALKDVKTLDPSIVAADEAERLEEHRKGTTNLIIGGVILALTIIGIVWSMTKDSGSMKENVDRVLIAIGLGFFPFGLGLFFAIRGLVQRSK